MLRLVSIFIGATLLTACASAENVPTVINAGYISQVQQDLKSQVGQYNAAVQYYRAHRDQDPAFAGGGAFTCGDGSIDFDVTSIKVDLATTADDTAKANGSVSLPIYSLSPTGAVSHEVTNVQELIYVQWPDELKGVDASYLPPTRETLRPIAGMLMTLRDGLIAGARSGKSGAPVQCFRDFDVAKLGDAPHSYKMGVTVVNDSQFGISLKLAILSLGASGESKNTDANTITVSFKQSDLPNIDNTPTIVRCAKDRSKRCIKTKDGETMLGNQGVGIEATPPTTR